VIDAAATRLVRGRADGRCEYCRDPEILSLAAFHIEHIVARQHGGSDEPQNLALACPDCNLRKGPNLSGVEPATNEVTRLFHPRTDQWDEHFAWRGVRLEGRTAIGRATERLLALNSPARHKHRTLLVQLGML
jgi:hypothetical protein